MDCRQCLRGLERPKFPEVLKGPRGPRGLRFLEDPGDPEGPEGSQTSAYPARGLRAKTSEHFITCSYVKVKFAN